jgi:hypothetical protein
VRRTFVLSLISTALLVAAPGPQPFHRPLVFEPNRGQAPEQVKWIARASGYLLFITIDGVTMILPNDAADAYSWIQASVLSQREA